MELQLSWGPLVSVSILKGLLTNSSIALIDRDDILFWKEDSVGCFSVKSIYNLVYNQSGDRVKVLDIVWKNVAPFKVQCFGWVAWMGR